MNASYKKALVDVTRRRGRTVLVVLGIFIGVFGLVAITFTEDTIFNAFAFSVSGTTPDMIFTVDRLDPAVAGSLRAVPNVQAIQYQSSYLTNWIVSQAPGHAILAIDSYPDLQHTVLVGFQLTAGRYPAAADEIVMEYGDQSIQSFAPGDQVTVDSPQGTVPLRVVGLVRTPGVNPATSGRALGYMTDAGLLQLSGGGVQSAPAALHHVILVKTTNINQDQATATALQSVLRGDQIAVQNVDYPNHTDPATLQAISSVFSILRMLIIVAVVMSGILILNTVTTIMAEQTAIIGTMKAIGGTQGRIMRGYLTSVVIYSVLGTLPAVALGIVGGYALAVALTTTIPLDAGPFMLTPEVIPLGLAVGFGVPLLAALLPLWNGTRITVREALAAYGVSSGQGTGRGSWSLGRLPQLLALGLRGVFRKRWRAALTLLTLSVAGVCFLVVQTAITSVNGTVGAVYGRFDADVFADLPPASLQQIQSQISGVANIAHVERYAVGGTVTPWGRLEIWGFEANTELYHYQLTGGRWLQPGDTNVVLISDDAAAKSGLRIGDTLTITSRGGSATWNIIGTIKQPTENLGGLGSAITTTATLYQVQGVSTATSPPDVAERIMVQAQDRSPQAVNQLTTDLDMVLSGVPKYNPGASGPVQVSGADIYTVASESLRHQRSWYVLYDLLYAVALVVGAAGILGLANALVASVLERRREIGMLRTIGATGWQVAQVFWTEGLALGSIAWLVAAVVGLPLAYGFVQLLRQVVLPADFIVDATAFIVMLFAIALIATLASIAPASRAARLRIAEILHYE